MSKWQETDLGLIPNKWRIMKMKDIAQKMADAPFGSFLKTKDYQMDGAVVVQGKNISGRQCNWSDLRFVSIKKYNSLAKNQCFVGDLIFPKVGTIGKVGILTPFQDKSTYVLSTNTMMFRGNPDIVEQDFVYYYFTNKIIQHHIKKLNPNSVQPVFNFTALKNFLIPIPPLVEQRRIVRLLFAIDAKIHNLHCQNETLEAIAQTLFKQWFIKFQVPIEKGRMINSVLGEIPEKWRVGHLSELLEAVVSGDWGKKEESTPYLHRVTCLRGADLPGLKLGEVENIPFRFIKSRKLAKCQLQAGDLVIEISGGSATQSTGRMIYINEETIKQFNTPLICSNFCKFIRATNPKYQYFIYCLNNYFYKLGLFFQLQNGTTAIKNLDIKSYLNEIDIILPPIDLIELFNQTVKPLFTKVQTNNQQIQTLKTLQNTLLPRLMYGKLKVTA